MTIQICVQISVVSFIVPRCSGKGQAAQTILAIVNWYDQARLPAPPAPELLS